MYVYVHTHTHNFKLTLKSSTNFFTCNANTNHVTAAQTNQSIYVIIFIIISSNACYHL